MKYKLKTRKPFYFLGMLLVLMIVSLNNLIAINITKSEPTGIYIRDFSPVKKGDYVIIRKADVENFLIYTNVTIEDGLLKNIVATEGDSYIIKDDKFIVGNISVNIQKNVSSGRTLPQLKEGQYIVEKNNFLAISTYNEDSFDSRYMGELSKYAIVAKVRPLILF